MTVARCVSINSWLTVIDILFTLSSSLTCNRFSLRNPYFSRHIVKLYRSSRNDFLSRSLSVSLCLALLHQLSLLLTVRRAQNPIIHRHIPARFLLSQKTSSRALRFVRSFDLQKHTDPLNIEIRRNYHFFVLLVFSVECMDSSKRTSNAHNCRTSLPYFVKTSTTTQSRERKNKSYRLQHILRKLKRQRFKNP